MRSTVVNGEMMSRRTRQILLLLVTLCGILVVVIYRDQLNAETLQLWLAGFGRAGPLVFILIYSIGTMLFFPGSVLTLSGGFLFGPLWGTIYNLVGASIGATLSFLIARYVAADWVEKHSGKRIAGLQQGVEEEGWRFVAFVRLVPLFPFNLLNYALGLTRIPVLVSVVTSAIFMLPGAFAYTYLGYAGREAITGGEALVQKALLAIALFAIIAFIPRLIRRYRRVNIEK